MPKIAVACRILKRPTDRQLLFPHGYTDNRAKIENIGVSEGDNHRPREFSAGSAYLELEQVFSILSVGFHRSRNCGDQNAKRHPNVSVTQRQLDGLGHWRHGALEFNAVDPPTTQQPGAHREDYADDQQPLCSRRVAKDYEEFGQCISHPGSDWTAVTRFNQYPQLSTNRRGRITIIMNLGPIDRCIIE